MAINNINDKQSGSVVRSILNTVINAVNALSGSLSGISTKVTSIEGSLENYTITPEDKERLLTVVTTQELATALGGKVDTSPGGRLITTQEINKLSGAVDDVALEDAMASRVTLETKEVVLIATEYKNIVLYARDEGEEGVAEPRQVKVSLPDLINEIKEGVNYTYPTYRTLEGVQNGTNAQFKYRGTLVAESAELYIGALTYPVNIGFAFEGDTIVITGAPIPKAEDIMRLKAIYLT